MFGTQGFESLLSPTTNVRTESCFDTNCVDRGSVYKDVVDRRLCLQKRLSTKAHIQGQMPHPSDNKVCLSQGCDKQTFVVTGV